MSLKIASGLELPHDAITQTFAILARKGAGKTYTGMVMVEEMVEADLQVVVLDPLGAWWGLRSSADGKRSGLPITILGGEHGDVPLEPTAGRVIADLVTEHHRSFILDLSEFESNAAQDRFVADFAERLYRAKAKDRSPLHLMVDEADSFAPQRPQPGQQRMLGAFEAIVRRGRIRGLGCTMITQRPAVLNKNVLTQAECLVALQMTAPQDRAAIDEWVRGNGSKAERDELLDSLASLGQGEAWFWSPSWLRTFQRVQVRKRRTFDSSRTPEAGQAVMEPKKLSPVDLEALQDRIASTIEKAKANDPQELKKQIKALQVQLGAQKMETVIQEKLIQISEIPPDIAKFATEAISQTRDLLATLEKVVQVVDDFKPEVHETMGVPDSSSISKNQKTVQTLNHQSRVRQQLPARSATVNRSSGNSQVTDPAIDSLGKAEREILGVLAQFPEGQGKVQIALLTGRSHKGGGFNNALSSLRTNGLIEGRGVMQITQAGLELAGDVDPVPTGAGLAEWWSSKLGRAERTILDVLVNAYPQRLDKYEIAVRAGYEANGGGFNNALSRLRSLQLIEGRGEIQANSLLAS